MTGASTSGGTGWNVNGSQIDASLHIHYDDKDAINSLNELGNYINKISSGAKVSFEEMSSSLVQAFQNAGIDIEKFINILKSASPEAFTELSNKCDSLNIKMQSARAEADRLREELDTLSSSDGIRLLKEQINDLKDNITGLSDAGIREFSSFLQSINVDPYDFGGDVLRQVKYLEQEILEGTMTSSQAISNFKGNFTNLLPSGVETDAQAIYSVLSSMSELQSKISELSSKVDDMAANGVKVSGAIEGAGQSASSSASAFDGLIEKIKELGSDSDKAYVNVSKLTESLAQIATGTNDNALYAMSSTFKSIAEIGNEKFNSISKLSEALDKMSRLSGNGNTGLDALSKIDLSNFKIAKIDNGSIDGIVNLITKAGSADMSGLEKLSTIDWSNLNGFKFKTDKRNIDNVASLVTSVGGANISGLQALTAIDWSNLNKFDFKSDKRNVDNVTSLVTAVGGANMSGLETLAKIDWSNLNGLKLNKSSVDSIVSIAQVSGELEKLRLRVDAFTASQSSMQGQARANFQTGASYDAAAFYNGLAKDTADLGRLKSVSMEAKGGLDQLTKATIVYEDELNKLSTKIVGTIDDTGKFTEKTRVTTESTKAAQTEVTKYVASLEKMLEEIDTKKRALVDATNNNSANDLYVTTMLQDFDNIKSSLTSTLAGINTGINGNLDFVDILTSNKSAVDQVTDAYKNCIKMSTEYISVQNAAAKADDASAKAALNASSERAKVQSMMNSVASLQQKLTDANKQESEEYNKLAYAASALGSIMKQLSSNSVDAGGSTGLRERLNDLKTVIDSTTTAVNAYVSAQNAAAKADDASAKAALNASKERTNVQSMLNSIASLQQKLTDAGQSGSVEYKNLEYASKALGSIMKQLETNSKDAGGSNALRERLNDLKVSIDSTVKSVNEYAKATRDAKAAEKESTSNDLGFQNSKNDIEKMLSMIDRAKDSLNKLSVKNLLDSNGNSILTTLSDLSTRLTDIKTNLGATTDTKGLNDLKLQLAAINGEVINAVNNATSYANAQNMVNAKNNEAYRSETEKFEAIKSYENLLAKINADLTNYSTARTGKSSESYQQLEQNRAALEELRIAYDKGIISQQEFILGQKEISASTAAAEQSIKSSGEATKTLGERLAAAAGKFSSWLSVSRVIMRVISTIKSMINSAVEIDEAMTQLKIVTGATDDEMEKFSETTIKMAKELGHSVTEVAASIETFSRLGYTLSEASELAKYAEILANVASVDVSEATTGMTSIIKGYGMEVSESEHVADVLIEVGQKYAVSASEMMEAYEKSGAALNASNTSFEKSAGLIAAANAAVQNASTVGNALKTVSARIRGSVTELEELGEETEDLSEGLSKYAAEIKLLTGFDIMQDGTTNTYKDMYDIFEGIAEVWNDLSDTQQSRVSEILGGTRQLQVVSSIMTNWKDAANAYASAMDSAGVSTKSNAVYMESIQASVDQFKAALEELGTTVFQSDDLKGIVDLGTGLIEFINNISVFINKIGGLKTVLSVLLAKKTYTWLLGMWASIGKTITGVGTSLLAFSATFKTAFEMALVNGASKVTAAFTAMNASMMINPYMLAGAAIVAGLVGAVKLADKLNVTYDEQLEVVEDLTEEYDEMFGETSRYDELITKTRKLTEEEKKELAVLQAIKAEREAELETEKQKEFELFQQEQGTGAYEYVVDEASQNNVRYYGGGGIDYDKIRKDIYTTDQWQKLFSETKEQYENGEMTIGEYTSFLGNFLNEYESYYNSLKKYSTMEGFSEDQQYQMEVYEKVSEVYLKWKELSDDAVVVAKQNRDLFVEKMLDNGENMTAITQMEEYIELEEKYQDAVAQASRTAASERDKDIKSLMTWSDELSNAKAALEKYSNRVGDDTGKSVTEEFYDIYQTYADEVKSGNTGSPEAIAAMETFISPEKQRELGYDYAECGEFLGGELIKAMFAELDDEEDLGTQVLNAMYKYKDQFGEAVSFYKNDDGTMGMSYKSIEAIVEATGLAAELWEAVIAMVDSKGYQLAMSDEDRQELLTWVNENVDAAASMDEKVTDIVKHLSELDTEGDMEAGDFRNILNVLDEMGVISLDGLVQDIGDIIYYATAATKSLADVEARLKQLQAGGSVDLLSRPEVSMEEFMSDANGWAQDPDVQAAAAAKEYATVFTSTFSNEAGTIAMNFTPIIVDENGNYVDVMGYDEFVSYCEGIIKAYENGEDVSGADLKIGATFEGQDAIAQAEAAAQEIHELHEQMHDLDDEEDPVDIEITTNADEIYSEYDRLNSYKFDTQYIPIAIKDETSSNSKYGSKYLTDSQMDRLISVYSATGVANAEGTSGEKKSSKDVLVGELGQELKVSDGHYETVGDNGAEFIDLKKGDIIFNAEDTKKLLEGKSGVRGTALKEGNARAGLTKTGNYAIQAVTWDPTEGSGSSSSSSSDDDEQTWFEKQYNYHQHLVEMDQELIADYIAWLNSAYKQAYNEGIIELDDYYKYAEEVYSKLQEDFKDYLNDREFDIEMLEHQEGNTSRIAAAYKQLMVDVRSQIDAAYQSGLSDTDDYVQELWQKWWDYYDDLDDLREDAKDEAEDQIDSLVDYRIDMLKQQLEDEKESYEDRLSILKDFIDKQKELLQDEADEEDYLKEQAEKRKEVADLEAEMAQLEYDNSAWAQKKKLELQEELTEAREELQTFERDHAIEMTEDELDAIYELAEQSTEEQTDAIDEQLDNAQTLYEKALEDVKNNSQALYDEMVAYELKYGSGTAEAIEEMWTDAYKALQEYMDLFGEYYKGIELKNLTNYTQQTIDTTNPAGSSSNYTAPISLSEARSESTTTSTSTSAPSLTKGSYVDVKSGTKWYADSTGGGAWGWASGGTIKYINENGSHPYNINGAGWVRKEDIVGYAQGTSSATSGLHSFDEDGSEYLFSSSDGNKYKLFNSGDKVLSARAAQFLYDFANMGSGIYGATNGMNSSIGAIGASGSSASIVMGDIIIQGNADMDTVSEIRRAQRDNMDYILKQLNRLNR